MLPLGQIGLLMCSAGTANVKQPARKVTEEHEAKLRFYNPELHAASFVLPTFARKVIADANKDN